jgi:uncharacterized protein
MQNKVSRVIIDTNLWISFLITKDHTKLDKILLSGKFILVFSKELLDEFLGVTNRPKFRKYFSKTDIEDILTTIEEYADFVKVNTKVDLCRDFKDNFLLSLATDGNADFLITGDDDLLVMKQFRETEIITISNFLAL